MRRAATALALALGLVGCVVTAPQGDVVQLVTGVPPGLRGNNGEVACYTNSVTGLLTVDPTYGTAITGPYTPVVWRPGFTGRRVGSEVAVLDPKGNVVATTGHTYTIAGGYVGGGPDWPEMPTRVFWACDFVIPE